MVGWLPFSGKVMKKHGNNGINNGRLTLYGYFSVITPMRSWLAQGMRAFVVFGRWQSCCRHCNARCPYRKSVCRVIVPLVGTVSTSHRYGSYQTLVRTVPTVGSFSVVCKCLSEYLFFCLSFVAVVKVDGGSLVVPQSLFGVKFYKNKPFHRCFSGTVLGFQTHGLSDK